MEAEFKPDSAIVGRDGALEPEQDMLFAIGAETGGAERVSNRQRGTRSVQNR